MASEPSGDTGQLDAAELLRRVEACGVRVEVVPGVRLIAITTETRAGTVVDLCWNDGRRYPERTSNWDALNAIAVAALERCKRLGRWASVRAEMDQGKPLALAAVEALEAVTKGGERG